MNCNIRPDQTCVGFTTPCQEICARVGHRVFRVREHGNWGHGLTPGTTSTINCGSCQREDELGVEPVITS